MSITKIRNIFSMKRSKKGQANPEEEFSKKKKGFSLIEVLVGMGLVGIAMLGLAQLFIFSVKSNARADQIATASFLGQQQIEQLRNLTYDELNTLMTAPINEPVDINSDGTIDYTRITEIAAPDPGTWLVRVLVFTGDLSYKSTGDLIQNPMENKVKIDVTTIITR